MIDVAETNDFTLTSQWYDLGSEDPFKGLPFENPKDLIKTLEGLVSSALSSANKQNEVHVDHIICKIFPYFLSGYAFSWFSKLQPRSLTCWEDIKSAFLDKFFSETVAIRSKRFDYMIEKMTEDHEKGIMTSISQILDYVYSEQNGDPEIPTTHVKQPDIHDQHAYEDTQRDKLNRGHLVNHGTVEDDEQDGSGEPSIVEKADTSDSISASIDISTSEMIDTDLSHRLIPLEIHDATAVNARTERQRALNDYNSPEDFYAKRSALRRSTFQSSISELPTAYISLVGQTPFHGLYYEDATNHLEAFEDLVSTIKCNGVPEDYYFCKLFSYSLAGEAACWFRKLPQGSVTTWKDITNAFLNNFM